MRTTQEYFNLTIEELQEVRNKYGYTKEECLLLDESESTRFFESLEHLTESLDFYKANCYTIQDIFSMSDGRYALLLN